MTHPARSVLIVLLAALSPIGAGRVSAETTLRVGKSPSYLFAYVPLDVGIEKGIFAKHGLTIEPVMFAGAAKMDLALTADSIDIGMGSPTEFAAIVKGVPAIAIGVVAGPMLEFGIIVPYDSPATKAADLKGKIFGMATAGSITQWAIVELARVNGWDLATLKTVAIGGEPGAAAAALKTHQVDATVHNVMQGVAMERAKIGRVLFTVADYADHFIAHMMTGATVTLRDKPDAVRQFLAGYYESVAYMRTHKDETVAIARTVTGLSEEDEQREYDLLMPGLSSDGRFEAASMPRIGQSFVELGLLPTAPDMAKLYSEKYLPGS